MNTRPKNSKFRDRLNKILNDRRRMDPKYTIEQFAKDIGISRQSLSYYLTGNCIPNANMLKKICEKCNVPADWLIGISETKVPDPPLRTVKEGFNVDDAIEAIEDSRRDYIDKAITVIQNSLKLNDGYEIASECFIEAAENLKSIRGTIQYLEALKRVTDDTYPVFTPLLGD